MTKRREFRLHFHLHLYRTACGEYPEFHMHVHEEESAAPAAPRTPAPAARRAPPCLAGGLLISTPCGSAPTLTKITGPGTGEICISGRVLDSSIVRVYYKICHSPSEITDLPPSDAGYLDITAQDFTISAAGGVWSGSGLENYCVLWYEVVTAGANEIYRCPEIQFSAYESSMTECDAGLRRAWSARALEHPGAGGLPAECLLKPVGLPASGSLLCRPVRLQFLGTTGAGREISEWISAGDLDWSLRATRDACRAIAVVSLEAVLGVRLSQSLSWRCEEWQPFGRNRFTWSGGPLPDNCPHALVVQPA